MQTLKQRFTAWYRHNHGGSGTIWQCRFGSTIVEGADFIWRYAASYRKKRHP